MVKAADTRAVKVAMAVNNKVATAMVVDKVVAGERIESHDKTLNRASIIYETPKE